MVSTNFTSQIHKSHIDKNWIFCSTNSIASHNQFSITPNFVLSRSFAKKSKAKAEKEEKQKRKETADVPTEIDFADCENEFEQELNRLKEDLDKLRFGRLSPEHFQSISVLAYGDMTPISD